MVKEQPDDADWDPADVRYNTIQWIVNPGGGYAVPACEDVDADVDVDVDLVDFSAFQQSADGP